MFSFVRRCRSLAHLEHVPLGRVGRHQLGPRIPYPRVVAVAGLDCRNHLVVEPSSHPRLPVEPERLPLRHAVALGLHRLDVVRHTQFRGFAEQFLELVTVDDDVHVCHCYLILVTNVSTTL